VKEEEVEEGGGKKVDEAEVVEGGFGGEGGRGLVLGVETGGVQRLG
jgi:hypothetical protein